MSTKEERYPLEERIFDKVFKTAELAMFDKKDRMDYEDSLKNYRDIKNVVDTALEEGEIKGEIKGRKQQAIETAKKSILKGLSFDIIADITNLSIEEIQNIKNSLNL